MTTPKTGRPRGASRALAWSFGNSLISKVGTLGIGIVLARLLGPEQFGTYAVAFVALSAILAFNDLGVSLAIVRWPGDPRAIAPTVTTVSVIGSVLLFTIAFLLTPEYAAAMGAPSATPVVRVMLIGILVDGLVAAPAALLQREFRQGTRTGIDQLNVWLGAVVSIVLAVLGFGAMSLAIGRVVGSLVSGTLFLFVSPLPFRFGLDRAVLPGLLRFGLPLAGSSIIAFAIGYADQVVVGRVLGASILGFYVLAGNLSNWPVSIFSAPLRAVAPAAFSRIQDDPVQMDAGFRAAFRVLTAAAFPICLFLSAAADPIIRFVYGDVWAPAADALRWLGLLAALRILFELSYDFLVVKRRSSALLVIQALWGVILIPALVAGALWDGIAGAALGALAVAVLIVLPLYLRTLARSQVKVGALLARAAVPLLGGIVTFVVAFAISSTSLDPLPSAFLSGLTTLGIMGALFWWERGAIADLRRSWVPAAAGVVIESDAASSELP